jgi:flagellar biosynthesis/type III secretory pathway protein FliH
MSISNSEAKKIIKIQHIMHEYDQRACLAYAKEEGFARGEARGKKKGMEKVFSLLESGMSLAEAKRKLGLQ